MGIDPAPAGFRPDAAVMKKSSAPSDSTTSPSLPLRISPVRMPPSDDRPCGSGHLSRRFRLSGPDRRGADFVPNPGKAESAGIRTQFSRIAPRRRDAGPHRITSVATKRVSRHRERLPAAASPPFDAMARIPSRCRPTLLRRRLPLQRARSHGGMDGPGRSSTCGARHTEHDHCSSSTRWPIRPSGFSSVFQVPCQHFRKGNP
jgi:hypothetical protein